MKSIILNSDSDRILSLIRLCILSILWLKSLGKYEIGYGESVMPFIWYQTRSMEAYFDVNGIDHYHQ